MSDLSEQRQVDLAGRIRSGDSNAENELVRLLSPRVFTMLCARTRDREASRDLLQDVLINVLCALRNGQLRDPAKLVAFAHGVTRHVAQGYVRGQTGREQPIDQEPVACSAESAIEASERRDLVAQALKELDSLDRDILIRTLVDGQKPGIIAGALGLSPEVVRQRKSRATRKVAEFVKKAVTNLGHSTTFH